MHTLDLPNHLRPGHTTYPGQSHEPWAHQCHIRCHARTTRPARTVLVPVSIFRPLAPSCSTPNPSHPHERQARATQSDQSVHRPQQTNRQLTWRPSHITGAIGKQSRQYPPAVRGQVAGVCQATRQGSGGQPGQDEDRMPQGWQLLNSKQYSFKWDVPWGVGTTVAGMLVWFVSFTSIPVLAMAAVLSMGYVGFETGAPAIRMPDPATFMLATTALQTAVGLAVIRAVTAGPLERQQEEQQQGTPRDHLFNFSPKDPLTPPHGWAFWAAIGLILTRIVVEGTAYLSGLGWVGLSSYDDLLAISGTVEGLLPFIKLDLRTYLSLLLAAGVLAPVLEETVFRGFLLPSLCMYMPNWTAVGISSLLFGAAHLSERDLPVLVAEGCVLGLMYLRSRNLLTPIIIHGVWNSNVLLLLFTLVARGVDLTKDLT